jgi:hypothetical protein
MAAVARAGTEVALGRALGFPAFERAGALSSRAEAAAWATCPAPSAHSRNAITKKEATAAGPWPGHSPP